MPEKLGFIGLGIMGLPMSRNLMKAGFALTVHDVAAERMALAAKDGAQRAPSPAEVARAADILFTCLPSAEVVDQVVTGPRGVLEGARKGQVVVDCTTNYPPVSQRLAALLAGKGAEMLDAPVSGGDVGAIAGTLSIMVGGKPEVFQRCLPCFQAMGKRITLMGERVGAGGYAKLANQIMVAIHLASMGEALVFGAKAGLDLNKLTDALAGGMANSEAFRIKVPKVLSGKLEPGARATVQLKDLNYIAQTMESLGISLPVTHLVHSLYQELIDSGHGDEDHSAIVRVFERMAGVEARG